METLNGFFFMPVLIPRTLNTLVHTLKREIIANSAQDFKLTLYSMSSVPPLPTNEFN